MSPPLLSFREGLDDAIDEHSSHNQGGDTTATSPTAAGGGSSAAGSVNELSMGADLAHGVGGSGWGSEDLGQVQGGFGADWEKKALPPALATIPWSQTEER